MEANSEAVRGSDQSAAAFIPVREAIGVALRSLKYVRF